MLKAYSYVRFSTPEQARGDSLARQLKLSSEYAKEHGFILDDSLSMRDLGLSGFKGHNLKKGALGGFLDAVQKGVVPSGSLLLVESLDRISRAEITVQMTLFLHLINAGIVIVTLADGMSYSKETIDRQMNELLYSLVIMSRGHEESAIKSKRLKSAWAAKRAKGLAMTARCPAWLRLNRTTMQFQKIEDRCKLLEQIFRLAENGIGKGAIAKRLNEAKEPAWGRGKGWHSSYIQKILQNRSVLGEFQPHRMKDGKRVPTGEVIADYFPHVISDELFYTVRSKRKTQPQLVGRSSLSTANLFSGLIKCGYTGSSVVYVNKGRWQYLVADNARRGMGGTYSSWPYRDFETSFLTFLNEIGFEELLDSEWLARKLKLESDICRESETHERNRQQLARLVDAIADGTSPPNTVLAKISAMEAANEDIEKRLNGLRDELVKQHEFEKSARSTERDTISLISQRDEPRARETLRNQIRKQVEKIRIFPGGRIGGITGFAEHFFVDVGPTKPIVPPENIRSNREFQESIIARLRDGINTPTPRDGTPQDKPHRYFSVHFKTGAVKHVMPDSKDPAKIQRIMWTTEEHGGALPVMNVTLTDGISVSIDLNGPKRKHPGNGQLRRKR